MAGSTDSNASEQGRLNHSRRTVLLYVLGTALAIHLICVVILGSVPPISRDALNHHLAVPKMYLQHGGIYEIPSMHFSYFPMNLDLLYLLPLYLGIPFAAKYIHFLFALFTAGLIYRYLNEKLNALYGVIGALFFLTVPVIVKLSVTAYVDLGLIFFTWASLYFFLKWHDSGFRTRYLIYAAASCGLALGTKYNGLILLFIMTAIVPLVYSRTLNQSVADSDHRRKHLNSLEGLQYGIWFMLIALMLFSPWMIRNIIWKQNPVYPLYNGFFNPQPKTADNLDLQKEKKPPKNAFWMRRHVYKESLAQTVLIPIRMFFQGRDDDPKFFDGRLNPFLLLLPLLAFASLRGSPMAALKFDRKMLAIFALLFTLFVLFQADFRIRYMSPAVPALVALSVFGLRNLMHLVTSCGKAMQKAGLTLIAAAVLLMFGLNAHYIYGQFGYIQPFKYLTGKVSRDNYITYFRKEHPAMLYANQVLPKDAKVLCLTIGDRTFYLNRSAHLAEDFFDPKNGGFSESLLLERLKRYGTTHIIIDKSSLVNWVRHLPKEDQLAFVNVFQKHTKVLFEKYDVRLLEFRAQD